MKKYIKISLLVLSAALLVVILVFVSKKQRKMLCESINVEFVNNISGHQYLDENYIQSIIKADTIIGAKLKSIDISKIEHTLINNSYIRGVEVYKRINGEIKIDIVQRMPVVRIINKYNTGYYIGKEGILMPISEKISKRFIVANGDIAYVPNFDTIVNIYEVQFDNDTSVNVLRNIHELVSYIDNNRFWKAQIQQIYIDENKNIELVPLVGSHVLKLGTIDMYEEKFRKLQVMYQRGFSSLGWNKYKTVDLTYNKQVVCGK